MTRFSKMFRPGAYCAQMLVLTAPLLVAGCSSWFPDRTAQYLEAKRETPLVVPPDLTESNLRDDYPVPRIERQRALREIAEVPPPPEAESEVLAQEYRIRRSDDQVWLLAGEEPGRVWPALNRFWNQQGLEVTATAPKAGLMQASVAGNSARSRAMLESLGLSPDSRYQVQVKLDQGLRRRTSEVAVRLLPDAGESDGLEQRWAQATPQPEVEEKLLARIQDFLTQDEESRSYSLLAQDISGSAKVFLHEDAVPPYLQFNLSFERAWSAVGQALADAKIQVVDLNRSEGVYLVNFKPDAEASGGFFGWFDGEDEAQLSDRYNYRLVFEQVEGAIQVRVLGADTEAKTKRQVELLNRILENIA